MIFWRTEFRIIVQGFLDGVRVGVMVGGFLAALCVVALSPLIIACAIEAVFK